MRRDLNHTESLINKTWNNLFPKIYTLFFCMSVGAGLLGCSSQSIPISITTSTVEPKETITTIVNSTEPMHSSPQPNPTNTFVMDTPTPEATQSPAVRILNSACLNPSSYDSLENKPKGYLILSHLRKSWVLDLEANTTSPGVMETETLYTSDFSASPDGKWFANILTTIASGMDTLVIEPSDYVAGNLKGRRVFNGLGDLNSIIGWLDANHLAVIRDRKPFNSTLVLNPFTGNQEEFFLDQMDQNPMIMDATGYYFQSSNILPDPSLQLVVFPQESDGVYISLWDRKNRKILAHLKDLYAFKHDPLWSEDGKDFLIAVTTDGKLVQNWFRITRDGTINQLTHFEDNFDYFEISFSKRSPDGRFVVFAVETAPLDQGGIWKWLVLDTETRKLLDFCVQGQNRGLTMPVWSPDSKHFVVGNAKDDDGTAILVDIKQELAYKIAKNLSPMGWLIK